MSGSPLSAADKAFNINAIIDNLWDCVQQQADRIALLRINNSTFHCLVPEIWDTWHPNAKCVEAKKEEAGGVVYLDPMFNVNDPTRALVYMRAIRAIRLFALPNPQLEPYIRHLPNLKFVLAISKELGDIIIYEIQSRKDQLIAARCKKWRPHKGDIPLDPFLAILTREAKRSTPPGWTAKPTINFVVIVHSKAGKDLRQKRQPDELFVERFVFWDFHLVDLDIIRDLIDNRAIQYGSIELSDVKMTLHQCGAPDKHRELFPDRPFDEVQKFVADTAGKLELTNGRLTCFLQDLWQTPGLALTLRAFRELQFDLCIRPETDNQFIDLLDSGGSDVRWSSDMLSTSDGPSMSAIQEVLLGLCFPLDVVDSWTRDRDEGLATLTRVVDCFRLFALRLAGPDVRYLFCTASRRKFDMSREGAITMVLDDLLPKRRSVEFDGYWMA